jgi:3-phenylpropionate/trans-cinnamate dioxygenase ferredoxin subunit
MSDWINVCRPDEVPNEGFQLVDLEDTEAMVFNINGEFYAIEDVCTHDGGPLSDGDVENCEIICPRHAARFNIKTGDVTAPPAYENLHTFPVRIENDMVQIRDDRWD